MRVACTVIAMLIAGPAAMAATDGTKAAVTESFYHSVSFDRLHRGGADETIVRVADPANPSSTSFAWGGYNAAASKAVAIDNTAGNSFEDPCSGVIFNQQADMAGSYAYTRFDTTSTDFSSGAAVPSVVLDASQPGARISLKIYSSAFDQPQTEMLAVLIRDGSRWWVSSAKQVPAVNNAVGPLQTLDYEFHGPAAVTWTGVDMNSGGGADMDQVDNGGQAALIMGETGSPAFEAIEGMGLLVVEGPGSHFLGITEISLIGPAPENDL